MYPIAKPMLIATVIKPYLKCSGRSCCSRVIGFKKFFKRSVFICHEIEFFQDTRHVHEVTS